MAPSRSFQAPQRSHGLQAGQLSDVASSRPAKSSPLVHSYNQLVESVKRPMSVSASVPTRERAASESPLVERKKEDKTSPEQKTRHKSTPLKEQKKVEEETHKQRKQRKREERAMSTPLKEKKKEKKKEKETRRQRKKQKRKERAMSTPLDGVNERTKKSPVMQMEQTFTLPNSESEKLFHPKLMRGLEEDTGRAGNGEETQIAAHD